MREQVRNRWFDWGAEFRFSVLLLGLLAAGLGFNHLFDTTDQNVNTYADFAEPAGLQQHGG